MNASAAVKRLFQIEWAIKRINDQLRKVNDLAGKAAQDINAQRTNPNDLASIGWLGYVTTAIGSRTNNTPGTGAVCLVDPTTSPFQYLTDNTNIVPVINFTGGTPQPANTYAAGVIMNGTYVTLSGDCTPGTYNGSTGSQPPSARAAVTTQNNAAVTNQSGNAVTSQ